jgi:Flp pilus assembly CpaF family ATPase
LRAVREQVASAIDLIVQLERDASGRRFVTSITEVAGMEGDVVSTAELFARQRADGRGEPAPLAPTGVTSFRVRSRAAVPA